MKLAKCASCGASIIWIKTSAGRKTPIDAEETYGTAVWIRTQHTYPASWAIGEGKGYTSHFATCPNADKHRSKGKR